jgi:excisionase family DNA binding protein
MPRVADGETYYTASEAARYLGIARDTFNRNVREKILVYHLGALKRVYFRQSDLDRYKGARPVKDEGNESMQSEDNV